MAGVNSYCKQTEAEISAVESQAKSEGRYLCVEVSDGTGFGSSSVGAKQESAESAHAYASELFRRWMGAEEYRIVLGEKVPAAV